MARPTWKSVVQKVGGTLEIEQVVEHRLFLMALVRVIAILIRAVRIPAAVIIIVITSLAFGRLVGALDDLVQFAAIKPDAPALRTIIDFNALAVGNDQDDITLWTFHSEEVRDVTAAKLPPPARFILLRYGFNVHDFKPT